MHAFATEGFEVDTLRGGDSWSRLDGGRLVALHGADSFVVLRLEGRISCFELLLQLLDNDQVV